MPSQFFALCLKRELKTHYTPTCSEVSLQVDAPGNKPYSDPDNVSGTISLRGPLGYPHDYLDPGWVYEFELVDHLCPDGLRAACIERACNPNDGLGKVSLQVKDTGATGDRIPTKGTVVVAGPFAALPKCEVGAEYQLCWKSVGRCDKLQAKDEGAGS